jgi:hypothetical protein
MVLSIMGWLALADPGPHPAGKSSPFLSPVDTQIAFVKNSPLELWRKCEKYIL